MKRTAIKRNGRKVNDWIRVRRQLKAEFEARGITRCEFNLSPDCKRDNWLSFAHSKKRRFITTDAELRECALACTPCHNELDLRMTHAEMYDAVRNVIARRLTNAE